MLVPKLIIPMSPIFLTWNSIFIMAFLAETILVTYGVGFEQDVLFNPVYIVSSLIYLLDMPVRAKTGATVASKICLVPEQITAHYINKWLIYDLLATIPIEYATFFYDRELTRYLMLLKLIKVGRIIETLNMIKSNTN